jgi:hypothetical protein
MRLVNTDIAKLYIPILLSLGLLLALGYGPKTLAKERLYTEASLKGEYAYVATGEGGHVEVEGKDAPTGGGAVGVFNFDGSGNGSCGTITEVRVIAGKPNSGVKSTYLCHNVTYEVRSPMDLSETGEELPPQQNASGKMTITFSLVASENPSGIPGTESTFNTDFVITKAKKIQGKLVATEIFFYRHDRTATGNLVTGVFKRRIAASGQYTDASLQGNYAFASVGRYGETPQARGGIVTYDGKGNALGYATLNLFDNPADPSGRGIIRVGFTDVFTVNPDGTGDVFLDAKKQFRYAAFVITKAAKINGNLVATEIAFGAYYNPCCFEGAVNNFTTTLVTRLPDADW